MKDLPAPITPDRWIVGSYSFSAPAPPQKVAYCAARSRMSNAWSNANAFALKCADGDFALWKTPENS